jgi:hypothetical protein
MAIIPNDEKVFMVSNTTNTTYSGSQALKDMNEWYTMQDIADTVGSTGGSTNGPKESILTRIPNNYIRWRKTQYFWQSVQISSTTEQVIVNLIDAELGIFGLNGPGAFINLGDTITISGSSIAGNNGVWEVIGAFYEGISANTVTVKQTVDRKLTAELVPEPSNITCTYQKRTIVELSWVHAQLEDGTQIWEAYDYNNWNNDLINGYWVAIKPNYETGETTVLSTLKMSENFWDIWYDYTVKVEGDPNSVILTALSSGYGQNANVGSGVFKLTLTNGVLSLQETIYDLDKTFLELYLELTELNPEAEYTLNFSQPYYNSDNDWYGMMFGPEMGWYWVYETNTQYYVGYNMLTGETQLIDISESILDIKNINYNPENGLGDALKLIITAISHSKYGVLLQMNSDNGVVNTPTAFWSPNYTNVEYATILDMVDNNGDLINYGGLIYSLRYSINNDYFITAQNYQNNNGVSFTRKKLDDINAESEYETLTSYFSTTLYYGEGSLYSWERENSVIFSYTTTSETGYALRNDNFFVWRNDKQYPEFIKSPNMYPNMIEDGKLIGWDNSWTNPAVVTMTNIYNEDTF